MEIASVSIIKDALPLWVAGSPSPKTVQRLCDLAAFAAASAFALPIAELAAPSRRSPYAAFARQSAMYLCHVAFGLNFTEIGHAFGRHCTTVAYACRLIEERRDDPAIDAVIAPLEQACAELKQRFAAPVLS